MRERCGVTGAAVVMKYMSLHRQTNEREDKKKKKITFCCYTCSERVQRCETEWNRNEEESTWLDRMFRLFHCTTECRQIGRKIPNLREYMWMRIAWMRREAQKTKKNISTAHMEMYVVWLVAVRFFLLIHATALPIVPSSSSTSKSSSSPSFAFSAETHRLILNQGKTPWKIGMTGICVGSCGPVQHSTAHRCVAHTEKRNWKRKATKQKKTCINFEFDYMEVRFLRLFSYPISI